MANAFKDTVVDGDLTVTGTLTGDASGLTNVPAGDGTGDVNGPASATDHAVARFDNTTGKLIQNSAVLIGDTGAVSGVAALSARGNVNVGGVAVAEARYVEISNASGQRNGFRLFEGSNVRWVVQRDTDNSFKLLRYNASGVFQDYPLIVDQANGTLRCPNDIILGERADHASTPAAGFGYLWVRNDTPCVLVFTDDAGTDHVLGSGGGGGVTSVAVSGTDGIQVDSGSPITGSGTITLGIDAAALRTHINVENGATADQSDAEIETAYNNQVSVVGQAEAEAGTATTVRRWTAQRVAQAIAALAPGVTLAGTPNYLTISGQVITRALIDLASHVTGRLPLANVVELAQATILGRASGAGPGDATALSASQVRTIINVEDGAQVNTVTASNTVSLSNKEFVPRTGTATSSATPTINSDNVDHYSLTAQAGDITSMTTNLSGTIKERQVLTISITGTASRAITWGAKFENGAVALPSSTDGTKRLDVLFWGNSTTSKWRCMAAGSTA